jgi:hypothetical protein
MTMTMTIQQLISNAINVIYTQLYNDCLKSLDSGFIYKYRYNSINNSINIPIVTNDVELSQLTLPNFHNGLIQFQDKMVHVISTHEMFSQLLKDLPKEFNNLVLHKHTYSSDIDTITFSISYH